MPRLPRYEHNSAEFTRWINDPRTVEFTEPAAVQIAIAAMGLSGTGEYAQHWYVDRGVTVGFGMQYGPRVGSVVYNDLDYAASLEVGTGARQQGGRVRNPKHTLGRASQAILGRNNGRRRRRG